MPRVGGLVIVLGGILGVIALAIALLPNGGDRAPASSSPDSPATATTIRTAVRIFFFIFDLGGRFMSIA